MAERKVYVIRRNGRYYRLPARKGSKSLRRDEAIEEFLAGNLEPLGEYDTQGEAMRASS